MMSKKWKFLMCGLVCLLALSMSASALVTDPNIISGFAKISSDSDATEDMAKGSILEGAMPYVDRTYTFSEVSDANGIDCVRTLVDNKDYAGLELEVTLDKAGTLFLFIDNRVGDDDTADPPTLGGGLMDWVDANGFTQTPYTIEIAGNSPMTAYAKDVPAGTYRTFEQGTSHLAYLIAAIPDGYNLPPAISGVPATAELSLPTNQLVIDYLVSDYGENTSTTVDWVQTAGSTATIDTSVADQVTITFPGKGEYTIQVTVTDGDGLTTVKTVDVSVTLPIYAIEATQDIEYGNDGSLSASSRSNGSGIGFRNVGTRRRVAMAKYDLSALEPLGTNEVYTDVFLSMKGHMADSGDQVFAVRENLDDYDLNSGSWSTAPGLPNNPLPASDSPVTLDEADLTGVLLTFDAPAQGVRESTATSATLAEFINADTDDTLILLFAQLADNDGGGIVRSVEHTDTSFIPSDGTSEYDGIVIAYSKQVPTWAINPVPANYSNASQLLTTVSWTNPPEPAGTVTCDVYFGTEPNELAPNLGLTLIADDTTGTSATVSLAADTTYYWFVDATDSGTGITSEGNLWTFDTYNAAPEVSAGDDQYIWLNNNGDPATSTTALDGTVTDDGKPSGVINYLWEQIDGPQTVTIDPNDVEDITIVLPQTGTYSFRLTADDTVLSASDIVDVIVADSPCAAAKLAPGYAPIDGDIDEDCDVDLADFSAMALHWLECNSTLIDIGGSCD